MNANFGVFTLIFGKNGVWSLECQQINTVKKGYTWVMLDKLDNIEYEFYK